MSSLKLWHEAPESELLALVDEGTSLSDIRKEYQQPTWCSYPDALDGKMGCWALMDIKGLRATRTERGCMDCDFFKKCSKS